MGFLGGKIKKENINKNTSILLVAREFDSTLFSMGEWLSSKGVAFKCVEFKPIQYDEHKFLSFSVIFDKTPQSNYSVAFSNPSKPGIYWFNIGVSEESKWETLKEKQIIIAGFEHKPGDRGDKLLNSFIDKDRIVAYSSRNGAVGYGIIDKDKKEIYSLTDAGDGLGTLHRLNIRWIAKANSLEEGISSKDIKKNFGIYHPVQTSSAIDDEKGEKLIKAIEEKFHPRG